MPLIFQLIFAACKIIIIIKSVTNPYLAFGLMVIGNEFLEIWLWHSHIHLKFLYEKLQIQLLHKIVKLHLTNLMYSESVLGEITYLNESLNYSVPSDWTFTLTLFSRSKYLMCIVRWGNKFGDVHKTSYNFL